MQRKIIAGAVALLSTIGISTATATEYSFPTGMLVTIERDSVPIFDKNSNIVFQVINYFSASMPDPNTQFALRNEAGETLTVTPKGDKYLINEEIALGEKVYFAANEDEEGDPIRVMIQGPIKIGHVHFPTDNATLTPETRKALRLMAKEMADAKLTSAYLVGQTDREGNDVDNLVLSEKRVKAVARYLEKKLDALNVPDVVLITQNMGEYMSKHADEKASRTDRKVTVLIFPTIK